MAADCTSLGSSRSESYKCGQRLSRSLGPSREAELLPDIWGEHETAESWLRPPSCEDNPHKEVLETIWGSSHPRLATELDVP